MAACGSLHHIFENPIPENPSSFVETLSSSWKKIKPLKPPVDHSFTELFGELHFKENPDPSLSSSSSSSSATSSSSSSSSSTSSFPIDLFSQSYNGGQQEENKWTYHKRSESFSSMNSESLQLCTEGLGFESLDNVEDLKIEFHDTWLHHNDNDNDNSKDSLRMRGRMYTRGHSAEQYRKGKNNGRTFPPPISCIGRTGRPWVCFQSYRQDGRFVLKEIRIPTQECLHASREDGRLRLCFVQPSEDDDDDDDDVIKEDDSEAEEEEGGESSGEERENREQEEGEKRGDVGEEEEGEGEGAGMEKAETSDDFGRGNS